MMRDSARRSPSPVLAVIPARGGSKGVPRKNLRPLAGRPLLVHSVEHALAARSVDIVIVSTDDDEIATVALEAGAEVVMRPAELAGDRTPTLPVLTHVLEVLGPERQPGAVVTLQPTSPLRLPEHVDAAVALLDADCDSVVGVCEAEHTPYKMWRTEDGLLVPLIPGSRPGVPRQQLPSVLRENGAVYVTWRDVLVDLQSIWGTRTRPFPMDADSSVDIDTVQDFLVAELLLQHRLGEPIA